MDLERFSQKWVIIFFIDTEHASSLFIKEVTVVNIKQHTKEINKT